MGKLGTMFKKFLGFEEELLEEEEPKIDYEAELNRQKSYYGANQLKNETDENERSNDRVYGSNQSMNRKVKREEVVMYPKTFAEACDVVEKIEQGHIVIVDMDEVEIDTCKRIADFVLGAVYVLEGDVEKVSKKVFKFWVE